MHGRRPARFYGFDAWQLAARPSMCHSRMSGEGDLNALPLLHDSKVPWFSWFPRPTPLPYSAPPPLLVAPFKLACKRHLPESEIGLTLRRRPRRRRMGGGGGGRGEALTISGLFSFPKLDQLSNIQSVAGDRIAVGHWLGGFAGAGGPP